MMSFYQKMLAENIEMSGQTCYYPQTRHFQLWLVPQRFFWTFFSSGFHLIPRRQWGIALPHNQMSLSECQPGWYCLERIIYHMVCKQTSMYFPGLSLIGGRGYCSQLSNLWWMPNSVSKGFDTAMKKGSSRRFKQYPTIYMWVSSWLPFTVD